MRKKVFNVFLMVILVFGSFSIAKAVSSYKSQFTARYGTAGTTLDQCLLCHTSNTNPRASNVNSYGNDYANNGHNFAAIEQLDSDGDGFSNIAEINARTFPGDPNSKPTSAPVPPAPPKTLRLR